MATPELFSYRKRIAEGNVPDVFVYDQLPNALRIQIVQILKRAIGGYHVRYVGDYSNHPANNDGWESIESIVAHEHGLFQLSEGANRNVFERCADYLLNNRSVDHVLDLIEVCFRYIDHVARRFTDFDYRRCGITLTAADAISELNERFRRAGIGYRFESSNIVPVNSELVHAETVRPALQFLHQNGFEGPRDEFLNAFGHFKKGENRDAIIDANNAFESTLKAICDKRRWSYPSGARASDLLKVVRSNGLLPAYLDNSFDQLAATLKSGLPQVRNNEGGHGQGPALTETPDYVAAYALHLAASNILFLAEAHQALRG